MSLWLVRAGKHGEDENTALDKGIAIIGWIEMTDVSNIQCYEDMKQKYSEVYPDISSKAVMNKAAQLWAFLKKIQKDDFVVLPLKTRSLIAIGKVVGNYQYQDGRHTRKVQWIKDGIPRSVFGQDLLYSFGAFMTVCQIKRNNAEYRVKAILDGKPDPHLNGKKVKPAIDKIQDEIDGAEENIVDLEEQAFDQIRRLIGAKFRGHNLTRLVEAILNTHGYQTYRAPEGPDGGVDILAGYGPMGFDKPRICVQVKSGGRSKRFCSKGTGRGNEQSGRRPGVICFMGGFQ